MVREKMRESRWSE